MRLSYDTWIDTREKRVHACLLLFLSITILFLIPYLLLGILLLTRHSYASLYEMLSYPILDSSYLSRIILDVISLTSYDIFDIGKLLWSNIGPMEILEAVMFVAAYSIIINKKQTSIMILLLLFEIISCSIIVVIALKSSSLTQAIVFLRMIGLILIIVNSINLLLCLVYFTKQSKAYKESLAYEVIEIKEHMDELK